MIEDIKSFMKDIEMLNKKLDAQDKIINTQALEIAKMKAKIKKVIELLAEFDYDKNDKKITKYFISEMINLLGDKENE